MDRRTYESRPLRPSIAPGRHLVEERRERDRWNRQKKSQISAMKIVRGRKKDKAGEAAGRLLEMPGSKGLNRETGCKTSLLTKILNQGQERRVVENVKLYRGNFTS